MRKLNLKKLALTICLFGSVSAQPVMAGNIANCEVILMEKMEADGKDTGGRFASFRPAAEFISSVYDEEEGSANQLDGHDIRGVMCTRRNVIPTLRDFPILSTGIPFSVSENFDAPDSNLMTVYFKDDAFHHLYKGVDMTPDQQDELKNVMEVFNLQPHALGKANKVEPAKEKAAEEESIEKVKKLTEELAGAPDDTSLSAENSDNIEPEK